MRLVAAIPKSDFAQNVARDLKSLRVIWSWIYCALYVWMCVWATLYYPEAIPTAITVTGGVVSVIFTGYIFTKHLSRGRAESLNQTPPHLMTDDASD